MRKWLIQYLVRNLLAAVSINDLLTVTNHGLFIGGRKLSTDEEAQLISEAKSIKDSIVWQVMTNDIRYQANLLMFEKGTDGDKTMFGRAMLYNLEILEKFMSNVAKR